jgi:hypothetical protein
VRLGRALQVRVRLGKAREREERALQVRVRLGEAREREGRALQVGVRLGEAREREGRALQVRVRLGRELRVRVRVVTGLRGQVRLGRVRRRERGISASRSEAWEGPQVERRALQVRIRLGRACKRAGKVL